jgi:putative hemin transport protein
MHDAVQTNHDISTTARHSGKVSHRGIAQKLRLSEGALIGAHVGAAEADTNRVLHATRLRPDWPCIMASLEPLGEVMALTRNASCVHEKMGVYRNVNHQNHAGLVLGGAIDLRVFFQQWAHGFAVVEQTAQGAQRSLQFFDVQGVAIHKVFLKPHSKVEAYTGLVAHFSDSNQAQGIRTHTAAAPPTERPDAMIDMAGLHRAWGSMRDAGDFFGLLKRFGVTQTQALRLADPKYAQKVEADDCQTLLQAAAVDGVPIMVVVGNSGMTQIHTGPISKVSTMGPWVNVLDAGFNLHLREDHIASAWVVKRPTIDGLVTSLELFDARGETIAMIFCERKPGKQELCAWRALIENIHQ